MDIKTLALYFGCECKVLVKYQGPAAWVSAKLIGIVDNVITLLPRDIYGNDWIEPLSIESLDTIKLLLRPIDSMTQEEKHWWNAMKQRKGYMYRVHAENSMWLIEKRFDVFGLIYKGEALDATKQ